VQVGVVAALVDVGQAERVGVEATVEAGRFEDPGDMFMLRREDVESWGRVMPAPLCIAVGPVLR
jgi:hypothetical protein